MSATQPESKLVQRIRDELERRLHGCLILKMHGNPMQFGGIPDLLVFWQGRAYALEIKRQNGTETPDKARTRTSVLQVAMIRQLRSTGIRADVVCNIEEAWDVIAHGKMHFIDEKELVK